MTEKKAPFIAACAGMLLFGISLITLGSVALELRARFRLDGAEAGTLFSILPIGILGGSLIFGPVCDRYGYKALLILACLGMFLGFEGISYADSLASLKGSIFLFGLGGGIINGATNAVVSDISREKKGANLSLLGVFFGLGALGMPLLLGALSRFSRPVPPLEVVAAVGWVALAAGLFYAFVRFPPAKQAEGALRAHWRRLFQPLILLVAFFLFFQSSLEAILNNWTTTYLVERGIMERTLALYTLSVHIIGMVVMRLLTGSLLRSVSTIIILWICLFLLAAGIALMQLGTEQAAVMAGLFLSGAGLAGGFPIMLGFVGERYAALSGTAFSFVFAVALAGNMGINYAMGLIVEHYGVRQLITVSYIEIAAMAVLFFFIVRKLKGGMKLRAE